MKACARWGRPDPSITDDPACNCSMCRARRYDRLPKDAPAALREVMRP